MLFSAAEQRLFISYNSNAQDHCDQGKMHASLRGRMCMLPSEEVLNGAPGDMMEKQLSYRIVGGLPAFAVHLKLVAKGMFSPKSRFTVTVRC